jgi:VanZ family protein
MNLSKFKFRRDTLWPFLLAGTITWCSGQPAVVPAVRWLATDKVGHFVLYGVLATAIVRHPALARWPGCLPSPPGLWRGAWALILASGYGLGDEFRQGLTYGIRQFDLADWAADTVGAVVAVSLYVRWTWYRRLLEAPLAMKRTKAKAPEGSEDLATKGTEVTKSGNT